SGRTRAGYYIVYTRCKISQSESICTYDHTERGLLPRLETGLLAKMFTRKQRWRRVRMSRATGLQAADYAAMLGAHYDPRRTASAGAMLPAQQRAPSSLSLSLPSSPKSNDSNNKSSSNGDFLLSSPASNGCITFIKPAAASRGSSVTGTNSNDTDRDTATTNR
ncbi:unnamed protein product, partial [Sphacelaria rigidula]